MEIKEVTWREFREIIYLHLLEQKGTRLCRGQSDSRWNLCTSFHRANSKAATLIEYFQKLIPPLADSIGTLEKREINVKDAFVNGSFLAYAQHHGLPTPLLDWSYSPYKAAYYAFSEVNDINPQCSKVAIYVFNNELWAKDWSQVLDYTIVSPHVSLLTPLAMGNHRQISQQGTYIFTNVDDIEAYIQRKEQESNKTYLTKFVFDIKEKPLVMTELEAMGINAYTLFGGSEGMFRFFKESYFRTDKIGENQNEKFNQLLEIMSTNTTTEEVTNSNVAQELTNINQTVMDLGQENISTNKINN